MESKPLRHFFELRQNLVRVFLCSAHLKKTSLGEQTDRKGFREGILARLTGGGGMGVIADEGVSVVERLTLTENVANIF